MALTKTIEIDGRQVTFRASAAIPRIYTGVPDTTDEWLDMYSEMKNDEAPEAYNRIPTQQDFDRF